MLLVFIPRAPQSLAIIFNIIFFLLIINSFLMIISDPGIVDYQNRILDSEDPNILHCSVCRSTQNDKAVHCYECDVCIRGYDHHCDFMGKCIGGGNIWLFYIYVGVTPVYFIFTVILITISLPSN